jgi:hypothetical protein
LFKIRCKNQPQSTGCLQSHMLTTGLLYNLQRPYGARFFFFNMLHRKVPFSWHSTPHAVGYIYIPQGFTKTSHNWYILGIHFTEPLAFSATCCTSTTVNVRLQRKISQDRDNHNLIKLITWSPQPCVSTIYKLYKHHLELHFCQQIFHYNSQWSCFIFKIFQTWYPAPETCYPKLSIIFLPLLRTCATAALKKRQ